MIEQLIVELLQLDLLEWVIVAAFGLCGFVWLLLPFIVCGPRMFDGYFAGPCPPMEPEAEDE